MGGGLSALTSSLSSAIDDDLPVADPDKCQHKFCEKWGPGHYHCADCHSTIQDETLIASEDAIIDSIVDESVAEDGVYRGVSIQFLVDFATTCKCWDMTTRDVRRRFVMPATRASRCRFVELPEMQQSPQRYVGRAGTFVSHTWGAKFGDLVAALCDGGADRSRYVWVDIFAVRQWPSHKPDLDFSAVVRQCGSFVVVCSSLDEVRMANGGELMLSLTNFSAHVKNQIAFLRVWCLVEIHSAILSGAAIVMKCGSWGREKSGIVMFASDRTMLDNLSYMVDIESADATVASDKERILNEIRASEGGVDAVNRAVRGAITGSRVAHPLVQCAACDDQIALAEILKSPSEYIVSAAGSGYVKILQKLIDAGADVNHKLTVAENDIVTPIEAATAGGHVKCVLFLLKCTCDMENKGKLLVNASMYGHIAVVEILLDHGCDVNGVFDDSTALIVACMQGHTDCAKLLLDRGANLEYVMDNGVSAVGLAAAGGRAVTLQMLIENGANLTSEAHSAAAELALTTDNLDCLEILIENGCDLEAKYRGHTVLMKAAQQGKVAYVQYLIIAGSKLDTVDDAGRTALDFATEKGRTECVEFLQEQLMYPRG